MGAPLPNAIYDKLDSFPMGMHSGIPPNHLLREQLSAAVNITNRGGNPKTRPAIRKLNLSYEGESETLATEALFQGAAFHKGFGNYPNSLISSIGGRIFKYTVEGTNVAVQDISLAQVNDPTRPRAWLFQAQDFLIIQDGQSDPLFFDGLNLRRSLGAGGQELPAGRMGHYANGRVAMALLDGQSWIAGDLVYSTVSGTAAYNYRDSILRTTENASILGGRAFAVPIDAGQITAMFSVAIPDTSLGHGPLQIGTEDGIFSALLPLDATLWTTTQQPSQTVSLPNGGPTAHYGVVTVNGDAWYRSQDGIRSFVVARRDFNTWVQTPLSFEMHKILSFDTKHLLGHASSVNFNNRLLTTCSPYLERGRGVAHRGLIALDFCNISSLTVRSNPSYDGLWTGLNILQILKGKFHGVERCFIFALDADNKITLYELLEDGAEDFDFDGSSDVPIESWISTSAMFGRETDPDRIKLPLKKLLAADLWLEDLAGTVDVVMKYRSDQNPFWLDWKEFRLCASMCPPSCPLFEPAQYQFATYKRIPEPSDLCNSLTKRLERTGYSFQARLQWTGHAALKQMIAWALPIPETLELVCESQECKLLSGCDEAYFTYSIE
jgi:hypothetical protein